MQFPFVRSKQLYSICCKPCHSCAERVFWGSVSQQQRKRVHLSQFSPGESPKKGGDDIN